MYKLQKLDVYKRQQRQSETVVEVFHASGSFVFCPQRVIEPVSYTHLDVYKRQLLIRAEQLEQIRRFLSGPVRESPISLQRFLIDRDDADVVADTAEVGIQLITDRYVQGIKSRRKNRHAQNADKDDCFGN